MSLLSSQRSASTSAPFDIVIYTRGLPITGENPVDVSLGGSETAAVSMARALARLGHSVTVACSIDTLVESAGTTFLPHREVVPYVRARGCDLFVSCRHHDVLDRDLDARMVVLWYHDVAGNYSAEAHRHALSKASLSLFLSQFHLADFERRIRGLRRYAMVTSNGVDFDAMEALDAERDPSAGLTFAYASRPERGLDVLLRDIWPRLHSRFPEAQLLVCGYDTAAIPPPPELKRHYALCDHLMRVTPGVVPAMHLTRRRFWQKLAGCRALLYPTAFPEVSCMVALEAQALGVPVVTTDAFALRETVGFGDTRVGAPYGSDSYRDFFLDRTSRLVEDEAFFVRARDASRRHVGRATHSWDAIARSWESTFSELFRGRFEASRSGVLRRFLLDSDLAAARRLVDGEAQPSTVFDPYDLERLETAWRSAGKGPALDFPHKAERLRELIAWLRNERSTEGAQGRGGVEVLDDTLSAFVDPVEALEEAERRAELGVVGVVVSRNEGGSGAARFHDLRYPEMKRLLAGKRQLRLEPVSGESGSACFFAYRVSPGNRPGRLDFETKLGRTKPIPKISACLIVKNEESHLRRCVESFASIVDEIVLGDTGSTDGTRAVAEALGFTVEATPKARRRWVNVDFHDFAQARNALLARVDGEYVFWQDADEILVNGDALRRFVDENVFFDAIQIEQRHVVADGKISSGYPSRCFRPSTPEGPLAWYGAVHELVELGQNAIPERTTGLPEVYAVHTGYLLADVRNSKARGRNWELLLVDRRMNPDRFMGYALGMREYLELAREEIGRAGTMTRKAYQCLNLGYEIWHHYVRHFPAPFRTHAFEISRQILGILGEHRLTLRATGTVPIHVDYSFTATRGVLALDGKDIPRGRMHYADLDELREELNRRCDELALALAQVLGHELPPHAPDAAVPVSERMLDPELFGLSSSGSPLGEREAYLETEPPAGSKREPPVRRLELPPELFRTTKDAGGEDDA